MFNARRIVRTTAVLLAGVALASGAALAQVPPLKIGVVMAFTGLSAVLGQEMDDGIATFVQEHGDTVAGRKVVIVKRDTGGPLPDVAQRVMQDLVVNEKVDIVIGPDYTPTTAAIAPISTQAKKVVLVVTAAQTGIIDNAPYMVHFGFSQRQYEIPLAKWAAKNGLKNIFMLYANFGPGQDGANTFKETYTAAGGKIAGDVPFPLNTTDFAPFAQRVKDAKPDALWVFLVPGPQPGELLKALRENGAVGPGSTLKILDNGGISDEPNLDGIGNDAIGVISSFVYSDAHDSALNRSFVQRFERIDPKLRPDYIAAIGYDAMAAVYKVAAAQNGNLDPDRTLALLKGMKFEGPRGPIEIDPVTRTATANIYIRRIERRGAHLVNVEIDTSPMTKQ
jgi:branched-chain amino acid transport system substrate-binding protein